MTDLTPEALAILAGGEAAPKKSGRLATIGVVAGLTIVAIAGGVGFGMMLGGRIAPAATPVEEAAASDPAAPAVLDDTPAGSTIVPLDAVTADIAAPVGTQIRLEASLVMKPGSKADPELLAAQVQADTVVFVRTLEVAQLEGVRGLLHLREDILQRAQLRSPDVQDLLIRALVVK